MKTSIFLVLSQLANGFVLPAMQIPRVHNNNDQSGSQEGDLEQVHPDSKQLFDQVLIATADDDDNLDIESQDDNDFEFSARKDKPAVENTVISTGQSSAPIIYEPLPLHVSRAPQTVSQKTDAIVSPVALKQQNSSSFNNSNSANADVEDGHVSVQHLAPTTVTNLQAPIVKPVGVIPLPKPAIAMPIADAAAVIPVQASTARRIQNPGLALPLPLAAAAERRHGDFQTHVAATNLPVSHLPRIEGQKPSLPVSFPQPQPVEDAVSKQAVNETLAGPSTEIGQGDRASGLYPPTAATDPKPADAQETQAVETSSGTKAISLCLAPLFLLLL